MPDHQEIAAYGPADVEPYIVLGWTVLTPPTVAPVLRSPSGFCYHLDAQGRPLLASGLHRAMAPPKRSILPAWSVARKALGRPAWARWTRGIRPSVNAIGYIGHRLYRP